MRSVHRFLGTMIVIIGAGAIAVPPVFALEKYKYDFDPYFVGRSQYDCIIVKNLYQRYSIRVVAKATDPFTGEQLDRQVVREIRPGEGAKFTLTETIPQEHASRLEVLVSIFTYAHGGMLGREGADTGLPPVRGTRSLVKSKGSRGTILQVPGIPTRWNGNMQ